MSMVSQGFMLGVVIYTGEETKCHLNKIRGEYFSNQNEDGTTNPRVATIDKEINMAMKYVLLILASLSAFTSYTNGRHEGYVIYFIRQLLILCSIIPICMRINLDLSKIYYSYTITDDADLHGSKSHNC